MPINKNEIQAVFCVGDLISYANGCELRITGVFDNHILFCSTETAINDISVDYQTISDAFDAISANPQENPMSLFYGIVSEYNKRAEQAKRDEEVDAMWASAMVCELP